MRSLLAPLFLQVLLTLVLMFRLAYVRLRALQQRQVRIKDIALGQNAWPEAATKAANSFANQFEVPVLYYIAVLLCLHFQIESAVIIVFSWIFLVARVAHAFVHSTKNNVKTRFLFFVSSSISVVIIWILVFFHLFIIRSA